MLTRLIGMTSQIALNAEVPPARPTSRVSRWSRALDLVAACVLLAGIAIFAYGRSSLSAIADGSYVMPEGTTHVAQTERHDAQTKQGLWIVCAGLGLALASATQHALRGRRNS